MGAEMNARTVGVIIVRTIIISGTPMQTGIVTVVIIRSVVIARTVVTPGIWHGVFPATVVAVVPALFIECVHIVAHDILLKRVRPVAGRHRAAVAPTLESDPVFHRLLSPDHEVHLIDRGGAWPVIIPAGVSPAVVGSTTGQEETR